MDKHYDIQINKLKLVIWDLDDTFWHGILSEGEVCSDADNIQLVKDLTDRGIVNSICSKNDRNPVEDELIKEGCIDYFVFRSIDWTPKGPRVASLIKEMGLRPVNCLFIDDNQVNLNEVKFYSPDIMIAEPEYAIKRLQKYVSLSEMSDKKRSRLNQYKVLEKKQTAKKNAADNLSFLFESDTQVEIHYDCFNVIERIEELIGRTNQLNFTKLRSSEEEVKTLIDDKSVKKGYVTVKDKYGEYGIVGFFAVKNNKCIHFLFSCRTIGQGVEQWVYSKLGYPELTVVGDVVNPVSKEAGVPEWINQVKKNHVKQSSNNFGYKKDKIVFKGACDLSIMTSYINFENVVEEFTYIGKNGNRVEHHNHSINYLNLPFLSLEDRSSLLEDCLFNDEAIFNTSIYDSDVSMIFMSTQIEPMLGIYQRKSDDVKVAFGEYVYPLTEKKNWEGYVNGTLPCYQNRFTLDWIREFSSKFDFVGRITPDQYLSQLDELFKKINSHTYVCLLLGSEIPYELNDKIGYVDRHLYYKELNDKLRIYSKNNPRLLLINFTDYISGQKDFTNNINHYQRRVYYDAAKKANEYINNVLGEKSKIMSRWMLWKLEVLDKCRKAIHSMPHVYSLLKRNR